MTCIGIEFGGAIVKNRRSKEDIKPTSSAIEELALPGVFESISELVSIFDGQAWVITNVEPYVQTFILDWFKSANLFSRTGLNKEHVRFCRNQFDKEKICRELKITHFVGGRYIDLQVLRSTVEYLYAFDSVCPVYINCVNSWSQVVEMVRSSIENETI